MKTGNIGFPNIIDTTCELIHDKLIVAAAANTTLLIHGGGPNNGVTFYDNSTTARTITTVGNTKFDSSQYKFRVSSIKFDGAGDYISAPDSADWEFGTGDFTIDFWVRFAALPSSGNQYSFVGQWADNSNFWSLFLTQNGTQRIYFNHTVGGVETQFFSDESGMVANTWYHIALVRNGNNWNFYVNGVSIRATYSSSITMADFTAADLLIGYHLRWSGLYYINGWLDEVRISKGVARWTSAFTPPTVPYDSPLTQYVIDGLDGDTDLEYRAITMYVGGNTGNPGIIVHMNGDTATNYGWQYIGAESSSIYGDRATFSGFRNAYCNTGEVALTDMFIYAKTGNIRTMLAKWANAISGTTVYGLYSFGMSWNNTTDNVTNLLYKAQALNAIGVGSRIILLKKRALTTGVKTGVIDPQGTTYGHWQLIHDFTVTGAAITSHDITGLDGNKDVVYRLITRFVGAATSGLKLQPNSDAATNYGYQQLKAEDTTASAGRGTTNGFYMAFQIDTNKVSMSDTLIYAKSGTTRPGINCATYDISSTTVSGVVIHGQSWDNAADNITSLLIVSGTNAIGIGSHIELWRLNL